MRARITWAVVIVAVALPAAAFAASHSVWVVSAPSCITSNSVTHARIQFKPSKIEFGCSQHEGTYYAAEFIKGLKWSKWTGSTSVGTGTFEAGNCKPSCRHEHLTGYPAKITLAGAKKCPQESHKEFTSATFSFPHKQPPSPTGEGTYGLPCGGTLAARDARSIRAASP